MKWTSVHYAAQTPLAPWQDYRLPPVMQSWARTFMFATLTTSLHSALFTRMSPLCCVFPGCWRADYTRHICKPNSNKPRTRPFHSSLFNPFSLSLFLSNLLLPALPSWKNKLLLSTKCQVSVLQYSVSCMAACLQLTVCLWCMDYVRQQV